MNTHTSKDSVALWQMYIHSGVSAIARNPDADGITILRTEQGRECCFPIVLKQLDVAPIIDDLKLTGDTRIPYLIHVWKNHWLDLPPYDLRKALLALNPENRDTRLMLIGEESFRILTLAETMPPQTN